MKRSVLLGCALALGAILGSPPMTLAQTSTKDQDAYPWLEEVQGERALTWVRERNAVSLKALQASPNYAPLRQELLAVLNSRDRIAQVRRYGPWLYNLWQDEQHPRGLWRRTSLAEYRKPAALWQTVLDLDALGAAEKESWVFGGATCLGPDYRLCLLSLSRGGADAHVVREFDTQTLKFVEGGFQLPEAKSEVAWIDAEHIYVGTDFGPGTLTDSGYPRVIKRWQRGQALAQAKTVFEGQARDVAVSVQVDRTPGYERTLFSRALDFYNQNRFLLRGESLLELDLPSDMREQFWGARLLLQPRSDWQVGAEKFPAGALLLTDAAAYLRGERKFERLFTPTATRSLADYTLTRERVILNISDQVASRLEEWDLSAAPPQHRSVQAPFPGTLSLGGLFDSELAHDELAERYLVNYADFLTPDTLYLAQAGSDAREALKSREPQFKAAGMRAEQFFATSRDGTKVPYFVVWPKGAKADASNPTLLYGYGGFEVSMQPWYSGGFGRAWYARGGVLVLPISVAAASSGPVGIRPQ